MPDRSASTRRLWPALAGPGVVWLVLLFLVPFYAILAVAFGDLDPIFGNAVPIWNPLAWDFTLFNEIVERVFGGELGQVFIRTFVYVGLALTISFLIGYPVAYYVSRRAGPRRGLLLGLLLAPFWINYLMRMLAWINLLENDGYVNKFLMFLNVVDRPVGWLEGRPSTVILGLVYGYIPYMILPLFGFLDRIDVSLLESGRDLGGSPFSTFFRVTLPLSKPGILAGTIIVTLPMFGDYFTNNLLSGSPRTTMIGNLIDEAYSTTGQGPEMASYVLILMALLIVPMLYYLRSTARTAASR